MHVHLVFVTKYRRDVSTKTILDDLNLIFESVCNDFEAKLVEFWDGVFITEAGARIRRWKETGRIRRDDYRNVLNTWEVCLKITRGNRMTDWKYEKRTGDDNRDECAEMEIDAHAALRHRACGCVVCRL